MLQATVVDSLDGVGRVEWDALSGQTLEGYDYLMAVERAGLPGFRWRYVLVRDEGTLVAAAPAFHTQYDLETTLVGPSKRVISAARRLIPGLLSLRLAGIGSPCTTTTGLGIAPQVAQADRPRVLSELLAAFEADARAAGCGLLAVKDAPQDQQALWDEAACPRGYRPMASLPIATLDIDFADIDGYFARLSYGARKDMRRKLRVLDALRVEIRSEVDDVADQLHAFYEATRARADMALEHLTPAYFADVPRLMGGRAVWVLYFQGDELVGGNLLLQDGAALLDKYMLMNPAHGRALNLYFVSWFTNLRLCLERGLSTYVPGQAAYDDKLRLGCKLTRTSIYFRHRNTALNAIMQVFAPLFAADPTARRGGLVRGGSG
jgi:predicted N-acyltransferase